MELGMRLAAWWTWCRRAACGLVGDAGNAWCSKCWLCWRGLAVEMLRAWVRKRSSCRLRFGAWVGSGCGLAGEMMRVPSVAW